MSHPDRIRSQTNRVLQGLSADPGSADSLLTLRQDMQALASLLLPKSELPNLQKIAIVPDAELSRLPFDTMFALNEFQKPSSIRYLDAMQGITSYSHSSIKRPKDVHYPGAYR